MRNTPAIRACFLAAWMLVGTGLTGATPAHADPADQEAERAAAAAREAAQQNRNGVAAVLFEWAISLAPSRRKEWRLELAEQMTYSRRAGEAVPLFREVLAAGPASADEARRARLGLARALSWSQQTKASLREYDALLAQNPQDYDLRLKRAQVLSWMSRRGPAMQEYDALLRQDPTDVQAHLGRAEALSFMDRHREAIEEYEAVLCLEPGNATAQRNLARVQSWRSNHRDAQRRLSAFLHEHPGDTDALLYLAQAQYWMGRPDWAEHTLQDLLARDPQHQDGRKLLEEIQRRERPDSGVDYQVSHQSDRLVISAQSFQQDLPLNHGRTTVGPRYQRWDFDPGRGQVAIVNQRPGAYARHRLDDRSEMAASLFVDRIQPQGAGKDRTVLTYDTSLTLWPNKLLRFDVGSSRTTFDNIKSLSRGTTGTFANFSMDVAPDRNLRLTTRYNRGDFSDGNTRDWGQLEVERRVWSQPNVLVGGRYTSIGFSRLLDNGYFNPKSYHSTVGTMHLYGGAGGRLYYDLDGSYGRESANPGGSKPFSSAGLRLTYQIGRRVEIQGRYQYFSSRQASSGGFARRTAGLFVNVRL